MANAIRPFGASTLRISAMTTSGRGAKICPNWLSTTSKDPSGYGSASASPSTQTMSSCAKSDRSRKPVRAVPAKDPAPPPVLRPAQR